MATVSSFFKTVFSIQALTHIKRRTIGAARFLRYAASAVINTSFLIIGLIALFWVIINMVDDSIVITEFAVPSKVADVGYSGEVSAMSLKDHMQYIMKQASQTWSHNDQENYVNEAGSTSVQFEVAGIGFAPTQVIQIIKNTIGIHTDQIGAVILLDEREISCRVRIWYDGRQYSSLLSREHNGVIDQHVISNLIKDVARYVVSITDPLILGIYYSDLFGPLGRDPSEPHGDSLAITMFKKSIATQPRQRSNAYAWLAGSMFNRVAADSPSDTVRSLEAIKKALELDPRNANAYISWARIRLTNSQYTSAEVLIKKAISFDDTNDLAYWLLGGVQLLKKGQFDGDALSNFNHALARAPHKFWYSLSKSKVLALLGQYKDAVTEIEDASVSAGYTFPEAVVYETLLDMSEPRYIDANTFHRRLTRTSCNLGLNLARDLSQRKMQAHLAMRLGEVLNRSCSFSPDRKYLLAIIMANSNRKDASLAFLTEAARSGEVPNFKIFRNELCIDPPFDSAAFHSALISK